ncbi:WG repeat-containing protein [Algoriphagus sp. CAU 1675]|uniref:WG repeat-containing protein n=1 Tax=Algoriphagus sp. CAU 1675 TaxID=3032597 RepID=UPI0023DA446F|nr:WG repeat-containing protein [Algoriphagus sp. CAU 1675]MDF2158447.1 WG repeat-containing protein [Algoriphagus sp. CAU 1675]
MIRIFTLFSLLVFNSVIFKAQAQSWEVYDSDFQLKSHLVYQSVLLLGENTKVGKNELGLYLLSNEMKPIVDLEGSEIHQYLSPWIIVKGPNGIGAFHEYGQKALEPEYEEIQTFYNLLLAKKGTEFFLFQRGSGKTSSIGHAEEGWITNTGLVILKREGKYFFPLSKTPDKAFDFVEENEGDYLLVSTEEGFGLANLNGDLVLEPILDRLIHTKGNFFYGYDQNQYLLIEGDLIKANIRYNSFHEIRYENQLMTEYIHGKLRRIMKESGILYDTVGMVDVKQIDRDLYNIRFRDGSLGLYGKNGWLVKPMEATELIENGNEGLFPARQNGSKGFVNKYGQWVIKPDFMDVRAFSEGIGTTYQKGKWKLVNQQGINVGHFEWDEIGPFQSGIAFGTKDNLIYLVNQSGEKISEDGYERIYRTESKYFLVEKAGKTGIIDIDGNLILPVEFDYIRMENGKWLVVGKDQKTGILDQSGNTLLPIVYEEIIWDSSSRSIYAKATYEPVLVQIPEDSRKKRKRGD